MGMNGAPGVHTRYGGEDREHSWERGAGNGRLEVSVPALVRFRNDLFFSIWDCLFSEETKHAYFNSFSFLDLTVSMDGTVLQCPPYKYRVAESLRPLSPLLWHFIVSGLDYCVLCYFKSCFHLLSCFILFCCLLRIDYPVRALS